MTLGYSARTGGMKSTLLLRTRPMDTVCGPKQTVSYFFFFFLILRLLVDYFTILLEVVRGINRSHIK